MLIAIVGGKLQGVEAAYLAIKAGWQTLVIDKNPDAPATGFSDQFLEFEFGSKTPFPSSHPKIDLILPALEDETVLGMVKKWADRFHIPMAFDLDAFGLTNSKLKSNAFFKRIGLSLPTPWPECNFPVVVKPDTASGSHGVEILKDSDAFSLRFPDGRLPADTVIQAYMNGPSYSIEVLGRPGKYKVFQTTDLGMDNQYDCNRVTAPTILSKPLVRQFEKMARTLADQIRLTGIMDVEVILDNNELKLLEIDARLPSQTPTAVFWSKGINMVDMLARLFLNDDLETIEPGAGKYGTGENEEQFVLVEHIAVSGQKIDFPGEHVMAKASPLKIIPGFFHADEAVTSYAPGKKDWVATMIFKGNSWEKINTRRQETYHIISGQTDFLDKEILK